MQTSRDGVGAADRRYAMLLHDKTVGILIGEGFEELEFWVVYMRLIEEGAAVKLIGSRSGEEYHGKHGALPVKSRHSAADVRSENLDALHVPGGWAPDRIRRDKNMIALVRGMNEKGRIIGMICHGGLVGISAGIVTGKKATGSEGIKDDLVNAGAVWVDAPAFRDGNLVWGRVVEDIPAYCREFINAIAG